jgi:hypothetical protein
MKRFRGLSESERKQQQDEMHDWEELTEEWQQEQHESTYKLNQYSSHRYGNKYNNVREFTFNFNRKPGANDDEKEGNESNENENSDSSDDYRTKEEAAKARKEKEEREKAEAERKQKLAALCTFSSPHMYTFDVPIEPENFCTSDYWNFFCLFGLLLNSNWRFNEPSPAPFGTPQFSFSFSCVLNFLFSRSLNSICNCF